MSNLTLRKMSSFVFDLTLDYQNIIKYLAEHGSGNITNISQFTKNSENYQLDRWAIKKRIYGSSRFQSLLDRDYLIEKLENKHRFQKQERTFYLTSKGILASFATTSIKNNVAFKKIINFAINLDKEKKQTKFIYEFIISQIKYYLAYLYIQGIQLTWQNDTWLNYYNFLNESENGLDLEIKNKEILSEFRKIFEDYVVLRSIYHFLGGTVDKHLSDNIPNLWRYIDNKKLPKPLKKRKNWDSFVMSWFVSPQPQIPNPQEFRQIKHSDISKFVADKYIFSRLTVLEKLLLKKLKTIN